MKFTQPDTILPKKPAAHKAWIAIVGNPNCGKTALFNRLTGLHHKVGNYPGITVEKKTGIMRGTSLELHDLPGTYSLDAKSPDEQIVADMVTSWADPRRRPRAVLVVLDATNLSRSLFLALQILEHGLPTLVALNMIDELRRRGKSIDAEKLQRELGACAVIETSAKTGEGVARIIEAVEEMELTDLVPPQRTSLEVPESIRQAITPLQNFVALHDSVYSNHTIQTLKLLANTEKLGEFERHLSLHDKVELASLLEACRHKLVEQGLSPVFLESQMRYAYIDNLLTAIATDDAVDHKSRSERIDGLLTHPVWGTVSLLLVLGFIFNSIFTWAQLPMGWIESGVTWLAATLNTTLPQGAINSLVTDGVIPGVGNVIVFLPQIVLLIFFLGLLEDSGYMARMAFMLDRGLRRFGLQGKAVLPMLSGFACAIPAIMAARTIENRRDRLITIMLIPLLSCSARLPVYALLIAAFMPQQTVLGFLQIQSLALLGAYFLGFFTAMIASYFVKKLSRQKGQSHFIMELPPYRPPMLRSVFFKVYDGAKLFLINAGSIILAISIVLWFLASYPKVENAAELTPKERIEQSYAGRLGHAIEPAIAPLGFDWKIGVGLLTSFAAREVIVSSLATFYSLEEDDASLVEALRNDRQPDGSPTYPPLVGLSLLVFFVFAAQCMSTFAIIRRETNSWRWPVLMLIYMNVLAYGAALLVFQLGSLLGAG